MSFSGSSGISLFSDWLRICWIDLFNTTNLIQNLIYIRFGIILTLFYINFSRHDHHIELLINQFLRFSGFSINPFSFFLYSPFKSMEILLLWLFTTKQIWKQIFQVVLNLINCSVTVQVVRIVRKYTCILTEAEGCYCLETKPKTCPSLIIVCEISVSFRFWNLFFA